MSPFLPLSSNISGAIGMAGGTGSSNAVKLGSDNQGKSFGQMLQSAFDNMNSLQLNADEQARAYANHETSDLHSVMIATEEASISLQLATQVRNQVVTAYQSIMQMTV